MTRTQRLGLARKVTSNPLRKWRIFCDQIDQRLSNDAGSCNVFCWKKKCSEIWGSDSTLTGNNPSYIPKFVGPHWLHENFSKLLSGKGKLFPQNSWLLDAVKLHTRHLNKPISRATKISVGYLRAFFWGGGLQISSNIHSKAFSSWWLNQPICKIFSSNWIISPK